MEADQLYFSTLKQLINMNSKAFLLVVGFFLIVVIPEGVKSAVKSMRKLEKVVANFDDQNTRVKKQGEIAGKKGGKKGNFKHLVQKLKLEEDNDNDNEYINLSEESGSSRVIRDADKQMRRVKKQGEIAGKKGGKKGAFKHLVQKLVDV